MRSDGDGDGDGDGSGSEVGVGAPADGDGVPDGRGVGDGRRTPVIRTVLPNTSSATATIAATVRARLDINPMKRCGVSVGEA